MAVQFVSAFAAALHLALVPAPRSVVVHDGSVTNPTISCVRDASLGREAYRLEIDGKGARIVSATDAGELYARRTLKQLAGRDGVYPVVSIEDSPAFPWRGVQMDDSRHFFGKKAVLKTLETMADFKLNVFHWHLTDNEGWRLPIEGFPKLVETVRPVENRTNFRDASMEGSYGPFAYSREDIREILDCAARLNIKVVPEIEIPGHSRALLQAYPEFRCEVPAGSNGVDNVACVGSDATLRFFEGVLDQVAGLFPGEIIHIGGDECNRRGWKQCRRCQERMRKEGIESVASLQAWTTAHFERYLASKGRRLMGWDEIAEGGLPSGAMVMSWRGTDAGVEAAAKGHDIVMTPNEYCYFDYPQCVVNDPEKYPFNWTVFLPLAKVYAFDPIKGVPGRYRRHILGAQGNNWSEMTLNSRELEWKLWPRAAALAEVLWTAPAKRDFEGFCKRMEACRARLVDAGVNAAPVLIHADPGTTTRALLTRTATPGGERLDYVCGGTTAVLERTDGVLTLDVTGRKRRVFLRREPFFAIETQDAGAGAMLATARRKGSEIVVTVLFDGEFVTPKDRWDYGAELPKMENPSARPYEFLWANRRQDEFPPIAKLESAEGWSVSCSNASARISTSSDVALFGNSVVRLDYSANGESPEIRIVPASPIPLPDAFDTVSLWVYGNNIRGKPCPSVSIAAEFTTPAGGKTVRRLGGVWHKEWFMLSSVGARLPYGCRLSALCVTRGRQSDERTLYLTSLCAYTDPKRPLPLREAKLPSLDDMRSMIPPSVATAEKLEFKYPEDDADWSGLAFRYGDGDWIPLADGGGIFPRTAAKGSKVSFKVRGNSLVCDIERCNPGVEEVRFGALAAQEAPRLIGWPYYTYRYFNQWDVPILKGKGCGMAPCMYRPKIAMVKTGGRTLFIGAMFDWTVSAASGPICWDVARPGTAQLNGGVIYLPKTDGSLNPCRERFVWTFSESVADVFPTIPNPKSPYKSEAGSNSWISFPASKDRSRDIEYWRAVKEQGISHVVITDHEVGWRDGNESFTFRTRMAPAKGGDAGQRDYARTLIDGLGYIYGPYNNFTDYAPVNGFWSIDCAGRFPDGSLIPAWNRCYSPKAQWAVGMCAMLAPEIQRKFSFNAAYCDVHTCVTPWSRVDYDARNPEAGMFSGVFRRYCQIMLLQKNAWKGPVYSEGGIHWLYCGFTDGNYAQDGEYDFMNSPWLVDFDLKRMHPLCCNFGMGAPYMFFGKANAELRKKDPQAWMDRFTAATLAFGHPGFLVGRRNPEDLSLEKESYFPVQAIAARYTQMEASEILYAAADGTLYATSEALVNGAADRSQIKVVYTDGTVVAVNGNVSENFKVEVGGVVYTLPPNGWRAETADKSVVSFNGLEDGRRVKYAKSAEYDWRKD